MPAVKLIDVNVANQIVVAVQQNGMRLRFVDGVVRVEHGAHVRTSDFAHDGGGFVQTLHHVALAFGKGLNQNRHPAFGGVRRH